jgi:uncharacterized membrane protein YgdD (TMEM256/DUF423 family)
VTVAAGTQRGSRRALVAGAGLLALGTATGALGAHLLRARLGPDHYAILQTAVLYQFVNALGLLALGILQARGAGPGLRIASDLVLAGVLLFCGSLYVLLGGGPRALGVLTPLGGLALMAGWSVAALALLRSRAPPAA